MTRPARQIVLASIAVISATLLAIVLLNPRLLRDLEPPTEPAAVAQWLAAHPADWRTASVLSETALDSASPRRVQLWREAYAHAKRLAPTRGTANEAFVRGGLFHWYELAPRERGLVLDAAAPLMRDPKFFEAMHIPFWQLTRDFAWLRRVAPDTTDARAALRALALSRGLFSDYRVLREDLRRTTLQAFRARRSEADPAALLNLLPVPLEKADEPLMRGILEELDRRPFDVTQLSYRIGPLVEYAVHHDIQPLTGIVPLLGSRTPLLREVTRARAAVDLNNAPLATRIELASGIPGAAEWDPYFLDRARFEARRRNAASADAYIRRASLGGTTVAILAAATEIAETLGRNTDAARAQLLAKAREPRVWAGTCSLNELCTSAQTTVYVSRPEIEFTLTATQSDETPPYVEIFVDDARVAEGEVSDTRTFRVTTSEGLHDVEVRLVNPRTRNGIQRRVRLS